MNHNKIMKIKHLVTIGCTVAGCRSYSYVAFWTQVEGRDYITNTLCEVHMRETTDPVEIALIANLERNTKSLETGGTC